MKWHTSHQFPALRLVVRGREKYRVIKSVRDAAVTLISDWPSDDGEEYVVAVRTCLDALHDVVPPEAVREALIRAANEERISHISVVASAYPE
ncbi:DUF982 domain-containing protein [Agrobacterium sp. SHOUNA12C]|nr:MULTISPECIES: DUF982 domain-containing protein [Rhizobium]KAA6486461.1 DUF982 domain-containing protein [Agrobacterium sp. ICMP 7243]MCJ9719379.1 DUF982 domain-containing protein [Agrobacterium sp. BETTINA12B]MCJ9757376.1 DUF982 domain-containing protein [Agrobacterium sp. SHOUNA12C]OCI93731.1 hypothetical protein A6U85_21370 [Agrobacterium sp. 13-626]OCJ18568.1 hypothetical protein A6U88_11740 [Agrobacterium sp. B131/95]OCJ20920.1 hypothetical protein A6U89_14155 [Agrobacterium sp. B133/9